MQMLAQGSNAPERFASRGGDRGGRGRGASKKKKGAPNRDGYRFDSPKEEERFGMYNSYVNQAFSSRKNEDPVY